MKKKKYLNKSIQTIYKNMKVIIAITLFASKDILKYMNDMKHAMTAIITQELKYSILKHDMGVHRNSEHLHAHLTFICQTDKSKVYKILNDKIKRTPQWANYHEYMTKSDPDRVRKSAISFTWENDSKYDEFRALAYNLKEYASYEIMMEDYQFYETINIDTKLELEDLRKYGNALYAKSCRDNEKKQQNIKEKHDLKTNMYTFLIQRIEMDGKQFPKVTSHLPKDQMMITSQYIRYVSYHILKYYKDLDKSAPIGHLKNQAINFLYNNDYIDEEQILDYCNI